MRSCVQEYFACVAVCSKNILVWTRGIYYKRHYKSYFNNKANIAMVLKAPHVVYCQLGNFNQKRILKLKELRMNSPTEKRAFIAQWCSPNDINDTQLKVNHCLDFLYSVRKQIFPFFKKALDILGPKKFSNYVCNISSYITLFSLFSLTFEIQTLLDCLNLEHVVLTLNSALLMWVPKRDQVTNLLQPWKYTVTSLAS